MDVLAIGAPSLDNLDAAAERAIARLHRAVNIRRLSDEHWRTPPATDTFIPAVKARPLVEIPLTKRSAK